MMTSNYVDKQRQQEIADLWSTKIPLPRLLFIRFVLCNYDSCYENLLTAASVPSIRIDLLSLATDVFKCVNGLNPDHLNKMICKKNQIHMSYVTHPFCPDLKLIIVTMVSKVAMWNTLPVSLKSGLSLYEFKQMIKSWDGPSGCCSICILYTWI